MPSTFLRRDMAAKEAGVVMMFGTFTVSGGSGAVGTSSVVGFSAARTGTGEYTLTLDAGAFPGLLGLSVLLKDNTAAGDRGVWQLVDDSVASAGTLKIQHKAGSDGDATELGDGDAFVVTLFLKNSSVAI